uniref:Uncharacterized protein n=1 Tax=Rhizophora mucronata TaxID=61149 RepID=A0A2P2NZ39_RHIMU
MSFCWIGIGLSYYWGKFLCNFLYNFVWSPFSKIINNKSGEVIVTREGYYV